MMSTAPRRALAAIMALSLALSAHAAGDAVYQWSVPVPEKPGSRAFLWIPPGCKQVRAVVLAQNNMIEQNILEHAAFRAALAELDLAEVWIVPPSEMIFDFTKGAGERIEALMKSLAVESGYGELAFAPIAPLAHSACASFPWNFAAWNPGRTLAILSVHGDAPQTNRTGSGKPNPDWGDRTIDDVPGLMVMGEYEWADDRLLPALDYRARHPQAPIAMLAEPGHGHFDVSDPLVDYLAMFLRKAVEQRIPADAPTDRAPVLLPIDPTKGWLVERWHLDQPRKTPPAPFAKYPGDPKEAFWAFDEEMARATQDYLADQPRKLPQLVAFAQDEKRPGQGQSLAQVAVAFHPEADGITFPVNGTFLDKVGDDSPNLARWTYQPVGTPLGHATGGGPVVISRITGPVAKTGPNTFVVRLNRASSMPDGRNSDVWLLASHPGDAKYKSAVQQAMLKLPINTEGTTQTLTFPAIPDQRTGGKSLKLAATSDAHLPVQYYVREGPATIDGDTLKFTPIPPRAKLPLKVTVVAWQWGQSADPKIKAAPPVERTFSLNE